jgi:hypothetical protein
MTLLLKVISSADRSPVASDNPHGVYSDVVSCHFTRFDNGQAEAILYIRDAVKTATVPGYVEHLKSVIFNGDAYLMNGDGKTVSSFSALTSGDPRRDRPPAST